MKIELSAEIKSYAEINLWQKPTGLAKKLKKLKALETITQRERVNEKSKHNWTTSL